MSARERAPRWLPATAQHAAEAFASVRTEIESQARNFAAHGVPRRFEAMARRTDIGHALGLRAPTNRYGQRLGIPVRLPSGLTLRADHFWPATRTGRPMPAATVLIRTPYYRQSVFDARLIARQGFHVVVVSSRGRFGSDGLFDRPMTFEAEDGQGVVAWLRRQPFFDGRLITWGQSYLGYTQWALAIDPPPELRAMVVKVGPHRFVEAAYPGGTPAAGTMLYWAGMIHAQDLKPFGRYVLGSALPAGDGLERAIASRPLLDSYSIATGARLPFFEEWITSPPTDPFWSLADGTEALQRLEVPVLLQTGWYDLFLDYTLEQYRVLHERGQDVQLTIGPWIHSDPALMFGETFAEAIAWVRGALGEGERERTAPVKVGLTGTKLWCELPTWPPRSRPVTWWLGAAGSLSERRDQPAGHVEYSFDPGDPPPALGGAGLTGSLGVVDNRPLEARADVVTFTSPPLTEDLDIAGEASAELWLRSSRPTADFFVRLADVAPSAGRGRPGVSLNVCDAIRRLGPGSPGGLGRDGWRLQLTLGAITHRFRKGHRIRLVVCSGAAPRYQPNPGVLEPPATAQQQFQADQRIWFGGTRPSAITLPVVDAWPHAPGRWADAYRDEPAFAALVPQDGAGVPRVL